MSQPTIATRVYAVERDLARHELDIHDHDARLKTTEQTVAVMAARIGIYAALGSLIGGAVVSAVAAIVFNV